MEKASLLPECTFLDAQLTDALQSVIPCLLFRSSIRVNAAQIIEHWLRKCTRMFRIGKLNLSKPLVWIFSLAYHTHKLIVSIE